MRKPAALLLLLGCAEVLAPPDDAVLLVPIPYEYRVWWDELEACSGLDRDFDDVRFYALPISKYPKRSGRAEWGSGRGAIIMFRADLLNDKGLVKHEMMHVLGRFDGHPASYFNGGCGDLTWTHHELESVISP